MIARIEELMRVRGLTPAQVARAGGMDKSTLSNILSGKRPNPTARTVEQIATGLGTTIDYLRGVTDDPEPRGSAPWPEFALDVLEAMRRLSRGRNYELAVIARSFLATEAEREQVTRSELRDLLLAIGDKLGSAANVDLLLARLEAAERAAMPDRLGDVALVRRDE